MRHGEAEPLQEHDEARQLTKNGRAQAHAMGQWLSRQMFAPQAFLISPYLRAQQTANEVLQSNHASFSETCSDVIPSGNACIAIDYLETLISMHDEIDSWIVVAHMPIVSYLVDQLCPGELPIFQLAACAVIEYDEQSRKAHFVRMKVSELGN
ncbi:Phosphohistidine phosphatase SixA [Pseudoalteromonas luteoviolacea B = ATCC 29581]|nr:Phosphohistidine phosphatase SixA [Pseudoalteromonas luteoviolacea B = ATCC 29581]